MTAIRIYYIGIEEAFIGLKTILKQFSMSWSYTRVLNTSK